MRIIFTLLVVTSSLTSGKLANYPSAELRYLKRCSRNGRIDDLCIKQSIESIKPHLATGISHLNIPPFEPYSVDNYEFSTKELFNSYVNITNMKVYNLTKYEIFNIKFPANMSQIKFDAYFDKSPIHLSIICDINAIIFDIPITKVGYVMTWTLKKTKASITINGEFYKHSETKEEYYQVNNVLTVLKINSSEVYVGHLNEKNDLTSYLNFYLNRILNTKKIEKILPIIEIAASNVIKTTANKIFSYYQIKILMPPS